MFDIFRDIILEAQGIDSRKAEIERCKQKAEKKEKEKKERIIISKNIKNLISVLAILYLFSSIGTTIIMIKSGIILLVIRNIIQIIIAIASLILLRIKNKKAEISVIILVVVFYILQNSGLLFLM